MSFFYFENNVIFQNKLIVVCVIISLHKKDVYVMLYLENVFCILKMYLILYNYRYHEIRDFNYLTHAAVSKSKETRHFEQIVWKADQRAGFGMARHTESKTLVIIGRYANPPMAGKEKENIEPLINS